MVQRVVLSCTGKPKKTRFICRGTHKCSKSIKQTSMQTTGCVIKKPHKYSRTQLKTTQSMKSLPNSLPCVKYRRNEHKTPDMHKTCANALPCVKYRRNGHKTPDMHKTCANAVKSGI
ncbi:unnamed protein product [Ectocarpus sp. 4 AP-2014]